MITISIPWRLSTFRDLTFLYFRRHRKTIHRTRKASFIGNTGKTNKAGLRFVSIDRIRREPLLNYAFRKHFANGTK